jgi:hypothetical protein
MVKKTRKINAGHYFTAFEEGKGYPIEYELTGDT